MESKYAHGLIERAGAERKSIASRLGQDLNILDVTARDVPHRFRDATWVRVQGDKGRSWKTQCKHNRHRPATCAEIKNAVVRPRRKRIDNRFLPGSITHHYVEKAFVEKSGKTKPYSVGNTRQSNHCLRR